MTHMLQVRNVSAETLALLKQRTRAAGVSLSDYARKELERVALLTFDARLGGATGPVCRIRVPG